MDERDQSVRSREILVTEEELANLSSFIAEVDSVEKVFRSNFQSSTPALYVKVEGFLDNLHNTRELFSRVRDELRLGRRVQVIPHQETHEFPTLEFEYSGQSLSIPWEDLNAFVQALHPDFQTVTHMSVIKFTNAFHRGRPVVFRGKLKKTD